MGNGAKSKIFPVVSMTWGSLAVAVVSILLLLTAALALRDLTHAVEMESLAFRQRLYSLPPKDRSKQAPISIIGFDYKTFGSEDFKRLFGNRVSGGIISRTTPAYVVRFFKRAHTQAVVFDMSFNGGKYEQDLAGDQELVDSLKQSKQFISALYFEPRADQSQGFSAQDKTTQKTLLQNAVSVKGVEQFPTLLAFRYQGLVPPYPNLFNNSPMRFYAAQGPLSNLDNRIGLGSSASNHQWWSPFSIYGDYLYPSLALGAILQGKNNLSISKDGRLSWHGGHVDLGQTGTPLIKWHGHGVDPTRPVYPEYSLWDIILSEMVLECKETPNKADCQNIKLPAKPILNPSDFNNRYVLIGFTLPDAMDTHKTIYGLRYSGIYILANILDNLLCDEFIKPAPFWLNSLAFLLLPALMTLAIWRFNKIWLSILIGITLAMGYVMLSIWLYNQQHLWISMVYPLIALATTFVGLYAYRYYQEQQKRQQLRFAFGKYVSPNIMHWIEQHPDKITLGGERREMTFLFCDIRGFTSFSDQHSPEEVQDLLTRYFSVMNTIILNDYQGTINKLIGDAVMAYWGFPLDSEDHAVLAVSAALAMQEAIEVWGQDPNNPPINIGIGVNTGEAVVGNIGSEGFMDFTVVGDAVNIASRLEGINKDLGTRVIISAATYAKVSSKIEARSLGHIQMRGKESSMEVFEPLKRL